MRQRLTLALISSVIQIGLGFFYCNFCCSGALQAIWILSITQSSPNYTPFGVAKFKIIHYLVRLSLISSGFCGFIRELTSLASRTELLFFLVGVFCEVRPGLSMTLVS